MVASDGMIRRNGMGARDAIAATWYAGARWRAMAPLSELPRYLEEAHRLLEVTRARSLELELAHPPLSQDFEQLRWFPLPHEAQAELRGEPCDRLIGRTALGLIQRRRHSG